MCRDVVVTVMVSVCVNCHMHDMSSCLTMSAQVAAAIQGPEPVSLGGIIGR